MDPLYLKNCDTKWKHEYVTLLLAMSNDELYAEMLDNQSPDDYDGGFSPRAAWRSSKSEELFERKLKEIGFLTT